MSQNSRKVPEWPRMIPVGPGRSWKVLEASRRFHKFPDSTICAPPPLALGGKAPHRGWTKFVPSPIRTRLSKVGRTPHKEGVLGESFPTKGGVLEGLHHPQISAKGPPGYLYNEGRGWGRNTLNPKAYAPPS